jgi:hypothetical protein
LIESPILRAFLRENLKSNFEPKLTLVNPTLVTEAFLEITIIDEQEYYTTYLEEA